MTARGKGQEPLKLPAEWESWRPFIEDAKKLATAIKVPLDTALILLALNEIAVKLDGTDDDEPWRGKK